MLFGDSEIPERLKKQLTTTKKAPTQKASIVFPTTKKSNRSCHDQNTNKLSLKHVMQVTYHL